MKLGKETCSVTNWMMSVNNSKPVAGNDFTILLWSDRMTGKVLEVKDDKHIVVCQYDDCYDQKTPKGETLSNHKFNVVFRYGAWRKENFYENIDGKFKQYKKINIIFNTRDGYFDTSF